MLCFRGGENADTVLLHGSGSLSARDAGHNLGLVSIFPWKKLRALAAQAALAALAFSAILFSLEEITAEAKPSSTPAVLVQRRTYTAEESKKLGDEARRLAEAQQQIWDRKMRAVSGSVCTGC